jgi:hypothetical protein
MIRFGMWREILDMALPGDPDLYLYTTCRDASGTRGGAGQSGAPWRGGRGTRQGRGGAGHASRRVDGLQQHRGRCAEGRRGDDGRRTRLQGRPDRRRARPSAPFGRDRRRAALRRALGLDAADAPRARRAPDGGAAVRGGGGRLPRRSRSRRHARARLPAPGQCLEPAWPARMPHPPGRGDGGAPHQAAARQGRARATVPIRASCYCRSQAKAA